MNLSNPEIDPDDDNYEQLPSKMFNLLEVRPIGVKKINVCSMFLLDFCIFLTFMWMLSYSIFLFEDQLDVPQIDLQKVSGKVLFIQSVVNLSLSLVIGLIYDTLGRKKPIVLVMIMTGATLIWIPFIPNVTQYYVAAALIAP